MEIRSISHSFTVRIEKLSIGGSYIYILAVEHFLRSNCMWKPITELGGGGNALFKYGSVAGRHQAFASWGCQYFPKVHHPCSMWGSACQGLKIDASCRSLQ